MSYIPIGHVGEFNSRHWPFPMADLLAEFPGCVAQVMHRPSGSKEYYPVADTRMEGTDLIWTYTEMDTAKKGWGECKLVLTDPDGSMLWMSDGIQTLCGDGYTVGENPPEPVVEWIQPLLTAAAGVRTAVAEVKQYANEAEAHALTAAEQANAAAEDAGKAAGSADAAHVDAVAAYQAQGLAEAYAANAKAAADRAEVDLQPVKAKLADHEGRITELEEKPCGEVTKEAIDEALGMDVPEEVGKLKENIAHQLPRPDSGIEVGKYFRVASIDEAGNPVLEAVDLPLASSATAGLVKLIGYRGLSIGSQQQLIMTNTNEAGFKSRAKENVLGFGAVNTSNFDVAVKTAMCDGKGAAWTAEEQAAAQQRLGIGKEWVLKATFDGSVKTINVDLTGCTELFVHSRVVATNTINLYAVMDGSASFINGIGTNAGYRECIVTYADNGMMTYTLDAKYKVDEESKLFGSNLTTIDYYGKRISDITGFAMSSIANHTECLIEIYAR